MFPRVIHVRHIKDYILELTFADGVRAKLDFRKKIVGRGGVFAPLQDNSLFKQVRVDPEIGTIVFPNDVDLDPDVLYSEATGKPIPELGVLTTSS
ncbi:MAG: DUF2442 domain-containing protein [Chloroflexi bacterium]|nr:DUF2442 domain-containing protein [Chloroflexota bacterium]